MEINRGEAGEEKKADGQLYFNEEHQTQDGRWFIQRNTCAAIRFHDSFWVFLPYKKLLGQTEMRTRERKE